MSRRDRPRKRFGREDWMATSFVWMFNVVLMGLAMLCAALTLEALRWM
jgi:hypothetical protein